MPENLSRALWVIYNRTENPADFVRADEQMMRERATAKDGGAREAEEYFSMRLPNMQAGPGQIEYRRAPQAWNERAREVLRQQYGAPRYEDAIRNLVPYKTPGEIIRQSESLPSSRSVGATPVDPLSFDKMGTTTFELGNRGGAPKDFVNPNQYFDLLNWHLQNLHDETRTPRSSEPEGMTPRARAKGGLVDDALHVVREHHADGEAVGQAPVATDNSERVRAAESAANLAKQIQAYEASMARIRQQPQDIQSMTHAPEKPRAPISVEILGKNREFGSAPYDVAGPLSTLAQGAYDMKTAPLYAAGMAFPPAAALGTAIDTAEGVASGSPTQVAMGALGGPLKVARNVIAPLAVATGVTAPDEAKAARLPRIGGVASALSKVAPKAADESLEQAMNVARQALQQPRELSPMGFYSHGAETAAALQQAKGTPEQYAAMLQKAGVKPAELEGFGEAFAGRPSVTREEIAAHFKERMPQIEETVLGTPRPEQMKVLRDEYARAEYGEDFSGLASEYKRRIDDLIMDRRSTTKFGQYTLPGGENYREVLLKYGETPEAKMERAKSYVRPDIWEAMTDAQRQQYLATPDKSLFKSQHWDDPNVLAHLRMADRTGPNGEKILHVEEIQSDWGQKGKKEGFVTKYNPEDIKEIDPANITSERRRNEFWNFQTPTGAIDVPRNDRWPTIEAARQHILDNVKPTGVPTAPYVTNTQAWTDLALKRALREAAEGGYDKLVWTPGAEQAKRYDLSKQIDALQYVPASEKIYAYKNGQLVINKAAKPEELEGLVGKDVAKKLLETEPQVGSYGNPAHYLAGQDLSVGGEGMKGYYDKIVPNQLSKLVKKLDPSAKVGITDVLLPPKAGIGHNNPPFEAPGLTITPKMREAIMKGQTAFKDGGSVVDRALMLVSKQA
jgi:hypothetical protein